MTIKFVGLSDAVYTENYSITLKDCTSLTISKPADLAGSPYEVGFGSSFSKVVNWGDFNYGSDASSCPVTHEFVKI